jgi:uncharacterized protein (TIGR03083 family)
MNFLEAIRRDSDRFYATALEADPERPVPGCPDWTIGDLVWHLGGCHWFWGTDIETRASGPEEIERAAPERPATYADTIVWGRAQADRMIELLESTADDVRVWTWALDERAHNVGFIRRHQVQEAAIHRWDIGRAAGRQPAPIEPELAADSLDEVLAVSLPWGVHPEKPLAGSVHIHCTDTDGEWLIHPGGRVEPLHAKGDVAIRGTASDLLLAVYTRVPIGDLELIGDASLAHELIARINTE